MRYRVQFRFNESTGEVELFEVDTIDADATAAGHNAAHHDVATEVASVLEPGAEIEELPGQPGSRPTPPIIDPEDTKRKKQETRRA